MPKTWTDIEERALMCPFLNQAVYAVRAGLATKEEALMIVALGMSDALVKTQKLATDALSMNPKPILMDANGELREIIYAVK